MVAGRRQRQAQKLQEQQISKALAKPEASSNHVAFDDDDDDDDADAFGQARVIASESTAEAMNGSNGAAGPLSEDSDDDDAPIEEVSNKTSRKQASQDFARLKRQEKAEKAKRQAAAEVKRRQKKSEIAKVPQAANVGADQDDKTASDEDDGERSGDDDAGSSSRLDPSLFAQVFSQPVSAPRSILKKRSAEERADEVAQLQRERKLRRKQQRAGGVVKGRDGLPMKKTDDGTILRALNASASQYQKLFDPEEDDQPDEPLDTMVRPTPLDPSASLPNAKVRSFKKRALGKRAPSSKQSSSLDQSKSKKSEDDPLGLNDPAFLPGGEFYHLVNKGHKTKAKQSRKDTPVTARQAYRGAGVRKDAVSVLRARSRSGPSLGFARSQEDDDDD